MLIDVGVPISHEDCAVHAELIEGRARLPRTGEVATGDVLNAHLRRLRLPPGSPPPLPLESRSWLQVSIHGAVGASMQPPIRRAFSPDLTQMAPLKKRMGFESRR